MSFSDVGTEWYTKPPSSINGRGDCLRVVDRQVDWSSEDSTPLWLHCALTGRLLQDGDGPVVADEKGNLFLKEQVILALLKKRMPEHLRHIRSLSCVTNCDLRCLHGIPVCPVTGDDLRTQPSVLLRPCGCIVSASAVRLGKNSHNGRSFHSHGNAVTSCESCGAAIRSETLLVGKEANSTGKGQSYASRRKRTRNDD